jgi:hypothetical protein
MNPIQDSSNYLLYIKHIKSYFLLSVRYPNHIIPWKLGLMHTERVRKLSRMVRTYRENWLYKTRYNSYTVKDKQTKLDMWTDVDW